MEELARNLYYTGILFYLAGFISLFFNKDLKSSKITIALILCGFAIHTISLGIYIWLCGYIPVHKRTQNTLPRTWGMGIVLCYTMFKYRSRLETGAFILTLILIFVSGLPYKLPSQMLIKDVFMGVPPFFWFHLYDASFVIFAYCFSISICGLILMRKNHGKPEKQIHLRIQNTALWGFVIFTMGQIAGSVWAMIDFGDYWHWKPMHLLSVSTWMFYAAIVHLKWIRGMSEKALPIMGITGFTGVFWWTIYHDFSKQIVGFLKEVFL